MFLQGRESRKDTSNDTSMSKFRPASLAEARANFKPMKKSRINRGEKISPAARAKRFQTLRASSVWSQTVRSRDDHRCQRCGKRDEHNNHAHHVAPRSRRPDLKSVLNNGKTVCPTCHDWIHSNPLEAEAVGLLSSATYEAAMKL